MRRDGIEVALAATVGAVIALVIWGLMQRTSDPADNDASSPTTVAEASTGPTTQPLREQADLDAFLDAFRASRTGTYQVTGRVQIAQAGTDDTTQLIVSTVRRGSDVIEEAGTTLLVILDGQEQSCERIFGGDLTCGEVLVPSSADDDVAAIERLFTGADPDYLLYAEDDDCWQLVATANPAPAQWGQSTTICFDPETGAIARQTTSSVQGTRTYVAETISGEVTDEDLIPPS
ncbi:MAG: hypothetical protein R2733_09475 [Acidimicrobiales bacterium]